MTNNRFTSVPRSDVSATIYRAIEGKVETIFGDSVAVIEEYNHGVHVAFDHAPPRNADLVIGADGLHSRVRQLVFGPESDFNVSLDYHVAAFEVEGYRRRDELIYLSHGLPGRQISRFSMRDDKTLFLFVFRDEYMRGDDPKSILRNAFADAGWSGSGSKKSSNPLRISTSTRSARFGWTAGRGDGSHWSATQQRASR